MIKIIPVSQLKCGMFIHKLDCGWLHHPFLRNQFALDSESDLARIVEAGVGEVHIDTDKGYDVDEAPGAESPELDIPAQRPAVAETVSIDPDVPFQEELVQARKVYSEASLIIREVMRDVRLGQQVRLEQLEPVVEKISASILRNAYALLSLTRIKNKDVYTFQHSVSVCALMVAFSRHSGLSEEVCQQAGIGGLLHDVGKMRTPDKVLNKPGKLTDKELAVMRQHVAAGREILELGPDIPTTALEIAVQHHERFDGSGYPLGLKTEQISRMGHMAAIVDVYDAMTSDRVYQKAMVPTDAVAAIFGLSKCQLNPVLVHAFTRVIGIYPVGVLVMLESGRIAVVVEQHEAKLLQPVVRVIYDAKRHHYLPPEDVDLSGPMGNGGADRIVGHELPEKWRINPMRFL